MPAEAQYYLSCTGCGALAKEKIGDQELTLFGENELEVREEALELGWRTNAYNDDTNEGQERDYCPKCVADIHSQMKAFDVNNRPDIGICAASTSHELQRLEMIETALDDSDAKAAQNAAQAILSMEHPETHKKTSLVACKSDAEIEQLYEKSHPIIVD
ncbi:hypothetical protein TUMSATVNIG1_61200 (plasmid) [Vibrio nigripulchritudo]|uniref:hypothetical protein n=1 Tax=Vibrio nigripulchritudo TaxID=28173 RepID=UPI00190A8C0E|nr:hypothetical protein [Vibrio nigripulchritudo]BCL74136.1 hypothetical protein VNTUMSATTG_60730 [Vibrio nigripulchritudo]BDU35511.1 hypothetical protein TUMSATVNIG1_61200 [Vibrio nigripulchritudo]